MLTTGSEVAGYRIEGILGHGGMGVVYEARQLSLNRLVALKLLAPQLGMDDSFRERFRHEGRIQGALDHPHIVTVHEAGEIDEGLYLVMRLIKGVTLKDLIIARELEVARTLRLLTPIADALDTAHEAGLIHRDIKPQNILVGARDHPYLADFGLTKAIDDVGLTRTGQFVGTVDYIAPEQLRGEKATNCGDVYSFAAVLYECLTGVVPYPRSSDAAVMYAHLTEPRPLVTEQRPELGSAIDDVLVRAMSTDPKERHQSAGELIKDAEYAFGRRVRAAIKPPGPLERPEETGIRESEARVPTRPSRIRSPSTIGEELGRERPSTPVARETALSGPPGVEATQTPAQASPETASAGDRPAAGTAAGAGVPAPETRPGQARAARTRPRAAADATAPTAPKTGRSAAGAVPAEGRERRAASPALRIAALVLGVLVLAALAGVLGRALRGGGDSGQAATTPAPLTGDATTDLLAIRYPRGWQPRASHPHVPGLALQHDLALGPARRAGIGLVAGSAQSDDPTLLPRALRSRLGGRVSTDDRVRLGKVEAIRYRDLRVDGFGDRRLRLFVAPTTAGVATIACYADTASASAWASECDRVARTLKLTRASAYGLAPDADYAAGLSSTLRTLRGRRTAARSALARAHTRRRQQRAAAGLAGAFRSAARSVGGLESSVTPAAVGANRAVATALRRTAAGYAHLARAAQRSDARAFGAARREVGAGEAAVQRALDSLKQLGYAVT